MGESQRAELRRLWETHQQASRPPAEDNEAWASLMEDDAFIAGVISSVVNPGQRLRVDQRDILKRCLANLDVVLPQLDGPSQAYAGLLRRMAVEALDL